MPETSALVHVLRDHGLAAVVSGAGPSILVLADDPAQRLVAADLVASTAKGAWQSLMLAVDFKGATVLTHQVEAAAQP
jgi:homoserine kinase